MFGLPEYLTLSISSSWFITILTMYVIFKLIQKFLVLNIQGKVVFITGCDCGFGRSLVHAFLKQGCIVFAGCLQQKSVDEYNNLNNLNVRGLLVDVTKQEDIDTAVAEIQRTKRPLLCIVNNAVISSFGWCEMIDIETYKFIGDVNIYGMIRVCKSFLPLIRQHKGRIIQMGSIGPCLNAPFGSAYLNSKAAMLSFSSSLAQELRPLGVTVSVIQPGFFKSNLLDSAKEKGFEESQKLLDMEKVYGNYSKKMDEVKEKILMSESLNGDDTPVCNAAVHAASAYFPPYRYIVGYDAEIIYLLHFIIPHRLLEQLMSFV